MKEGSEEQEWKAERDAGIRKYGDMEELVNTDISLNSAKHAISAPLRCYKVPDICCKEKKEAGLCPLISMCVTFCYCTVERLK